MKKSLLTGLLLVTMVLAASCGEDSAPATTTDGAGQVEPAPDTAAPATTNEAATLGDYAVVIKEAAIVTSDYEEGQIIAILYDFTNNSDETKGADLSVYAQAFQDGVELEHSYMANLPDGWESDNVNKEVRPGTTIECVECFILTSESDVEVEITEAFSFTDSGTAYKVFSIAALSQ